MKVLIKDANEAIISIPTNTLKEINWLVYRTAAIISMELGYKLPRKKPSGTSEWKIRLENEINKLGVDITKLKFLKEMMPAILPQTPPSPSKEQRGRGSRNKDRKSMNLGEA